MQLTTLEESVVSLKMTDMRHSSMILAENWRVGNLSLAVENNTNAALTAVSENEARKIAIQTLVEQLSTTNTQLNDMNDTLKGRISSVEGDLTTAKTDLQSKIDVLDEKVTALQNGGSSDAVLAEVLRDQGETWYHLNGGLKEVRIMSHVDNNPILLDGQYRSTTGTMSRNQYKQIARSGSTPW